MWVIWVLAVIVFLLMEHPVAFWVIFVPLVLLLILFTVGFFKNRGLGLSDLFMIYFILVVIIIALMAVVSIA